MNLTKQDLLRTYSSKPTMELLAIIDEEEGYTPLAIEVVHELVRARGVYPADMDELIVAWLLQDDEEFRRACFEEIAIWEKLLLYLGGSFVFWLMLLLVEPLRMRLLKRDGSSLKVKQTMLFVWAGLLGLLPMLLWGLLFDEIGMAVGWLSGFVAAYLWDRDATAKAQADYWRYMARRLSPGW